MRRLTGLFKGQNKFQMFRILLIFIGYTLFIVTMFVLGSAQPTEEGQPAQIAFETIMILIFIWIGYGLAFAFFGGVYPLIIEKRKQEEANEIDTCCEGTVKLGKSPSEYILLPFVYIEEIIIDWDDEKIQEFVNSEQGIRIKQILEREISIEAYTDLRKFEGMDESEDKKTLETHTKEILDGGTVEEQKKLYKYEAIMPFEEFNFSSDKLDQEKIKKLKYYIGLLDHVHHFEGFEDLPGWERAIIIMEEPIEKTLKTYTRPVLDQEDYEVRVHQVYTHYLCFGFLSCEIPVLYLYSSENMVGEQTNLIISSQDFNYIEIHILRYLLNEALFFNESGRLALDEEKRRAQAYYKKWELSAQQVELLDDTLASGLESRIMKDQENEIERLKKFKSLSAFLGVIIVILLIIIIVMGFQGIPKSKINPENLSLFYKFINYFLLKNIF